MDVTRKTAAVFIDADNFRLAALPEVYEQIATEWNATVRRAYGLGLSARQQVLRQTGTTPIEVVPNIKRKNSTDIVLTVEMMEQLYRGTTDGFVLASGDSDFTPLVLKVRELGKPIIVFGSTNTPMVLQRACTSFHVVDADREMRTRIPNANHGPSASSKTTPLTHDVKLLRETLENAFVELTENMATTTIARFSWFLRQKNPTFNPKNYGTRSLRSLLRQLGGFQIIPVKDKTQRVIDYEIVLKPPSRLPAEGHIVPFEQMRPAI